MMFSFLQNQEKEKFYINMIKENKEITYPGEVIASGYEYLAGDGCVRENKDIIAIRHGLISIENNLVKVIPLRGVYWPRVGNIVIGQIKDVVFNGWIVDISAPHLGFLPITECGEFVDREDLLSLYDINDVIITKIKQIQPRSITLTLREKGLGKITSGLLVKVDAAKVARIIGRQGSMVNAIKELTRTKIVVGQNGLIWIKGENADMELYAKEAIEMVAQNPLLDGLTDKVKEFLKQKIGK
jgi:exosome complex component RRP4